MYNAFYGFRRAPFAMLPDPDFLFLSPQHRRALSLLEYGILQRAGFCVVSGDVGSGKTTVMRALMQRLGDDVAVGLVAQTRCESFSELLQWIASAFGIDYRGCGKVELYDRFMEFVVQRYREGRRVVVLIDEAQHLDTALLEQLRMMSNVNTEQGQILQTVLVGQPGLLDLLRDPRLEQLAQRIALDCTLGPLPEDQVEPYVRHRLAVAQGDPGLFKAEAYPCIAAATGGNPRLLNILCDMALVFGFAEQTREIGLGLIEAVLADRSESLAPLRPASSRRGVDAARGLGAGPRPPGPNTIERLFKE